MGDKTKIEWSDATWNPTTGCTKISAGCTHCYIERTPPFRTRGRRFKGGSGPHDIGAAIPVELHPDRLDQPLRWRRPRRIFVNSLSDLFHVDIPSDYIAHVFAVMALAPRHTFQVLTKRPGRMRLLMGMAGFRTYVTDKVDDILDGYPVTPKSVSPMRWPLPNVWLGVSTEDQHAADLRVPELIRTPAAVRFISAEPLLGPIDLFGPALDAEGHSYPTDYGTGIEHDVSYTSGIDWVIVGGESGPGSRPMHPAWARSLRDQCVEHEVAFHFKQWGEYVPAVVRNDPQMLGGRAFDHPLGGRVAAMLRERPRPFTAATMRALAPGDKARGWTMLDEDTVAVRVGKNRAGRVLDGRTHDDQPPLAHEVSDG